MPVASGLPIVLSGSNSVGRVTASQAVSRGFDSRLPLQGPGDFCSLAFFIELYIGLNIGVEACLIHLSSPL